MRYFDFDALNHKVNIAEMFLLVAAVYGVIFGAAALYKWFDTR